MFIMYDSTTPEVIPANPHAVLAYINGEFANYEYCKEHFPHARILRMSVTGNVVADGYDIERSDYDPADVPGLYTKARDAGIWRPCFYAQLSGVMPAVKKELNTVVKTRQDVRLMVAYYNGTPDLPTGYDSHQFTDKALGRNLDESICASDFFQPVHPSAPAPKPPTEKPAEIWKAEVAVNLGTGHWNIKGLPGGSE